MNTTLEKTWEVKDRTYFLKRKKSPLTYHVRSKNLLWFDEESNKNREIRYAINQNSPFVDEQDGNARLGHIVFTDGVLYVPRTNQVLQKILSLYHPQADQKWEEFDPRQEAKDEVETFETKLEALKVVQELEIDHLEAVMRTELGGSVTEMTSKELKRDAYNFASRNPGLFMDLVNDDDIKLRNLANRSIEAGILKLTDDNTVFKFASNGKKVMTVPFDQHPFAALAQYFKTDDGIDLMKSITKKLS